MVKITNGKNVFEVSDGAYESIYKHQGYQVVRPKEVKPFEGHGHEAEKTADEMFLDEIVEKPVSQWSKDEVKHYATIKNIDIRGTRSVGEAKEVIKKYMSEE